ncbi:MAG: NAD(P)/FAD-dependent oxidoreductase [Solirubrobacteraceae bacterium]|jgi:NADH dehydrogenase
MSHRVVVIGGGFGGLRVVKDLRGADVEITLIDRRNFHLFQPLTYQVATGALSPGEIAYPLRALFKKRRDVHVLQGNVEGIDADTRTVRLATIDGLEPPPISYDTLVVAAGSAYSYFGHEQWREVAAEVKSLESALAVRSRLLAAFERAELSDDPAIDAAELTFVVVGAGPTGVEMAGQIAELARDTLRQDFRSIDPAHARILLVEAADHVLGAFPLSLSKRAARALARLGVTVMADRTVTDIDPTEVTLRAADGTEERIASRTVIWAAGVTASPLAGLLGELAGADVDRVGRLTVEADLTLAGHPEIFALGDMVRVRGGDGQAVTYPGVAAVAIQQGRYAARLIQDRICGRQTPPFHYHDKGNVATIGRRAAVVDVGFVRLSGTLAWLVWLVVHLWYLMGFENRLLVVIRWQISFFTRGRGARLITAPPWECQGYAPGAVRRPWP